MHRLILLLCLTSFPGWTASRRAILIGINEYNPPGSQASTAPPKKSPSRKALVGGDVRHWRYENLEGAINDVHLIKGLLLAPEFGFQETDIVQLITPEETTAENILATLRRELVETAGDKDIRIVYYSGHGNFIRNAALKRKDPKTQNEFDQTIVASDQWQGTTDIRDKEIGQILAQAAKQRVTVTFIADSCHSGSLTRGPANSRGRSRSNSGVRAGVNGVAFPEPVVDDPTEVNPERDGVLTLAAAQENQEALELWSEGAAHGGMTAALARAIREEGPYASMNRIFERMANYMKAANLVQTPVLGGEGRGDKDLLGRPARQEPFSVLVKQVEGGEVLLRAGDAIGLYPGSELRRISGKPAEQPVTLTVAKPLGLTESAATISPPGASVVVGDRFEITKWAGPAEPNLRVYVPPAASHEIISQAVERLAPLRDDPAIHWVDDPTGESSTDILRWNAGSWTLDHIGSDAKTTDLGAAPSAVEVKRALPPGARFFLWMPPSSAISSAIALGEGTKYPGIQRLRGAESGRADYRLYGLLIGSSIQYAWVQADAELGSRELPRVSPKGAKTAAPASLPPPLPARTDWFDSKADDAAASITEYAVRLGKLRAWLNLSGRPGQAPFPYSLALRKPGSNANVRGGMLTEGDEYKLFLQVDPKYAGQTIPRRFVYIFVIDRKGKGTLVAPRLAVGNAGNHLPKAPNDNTSTAIAAPLIPVTDELHDLTISEPFGIDTYILISTREEVQNLNVFNFDGVQSTRSAKGPSDNPLEELFGGCGDSRGVLVARAPTEWSIERITFQSAARR